MNLHKLCALTLVVGIFFQAAVFATPTLKRDGKNSELSPELKQNALKLLSEVGRETAQFKLPENRVRAAAIVAALMWEHDRAEANALYQSAFVELKNLFAEIGAAETVELTAAERTEHFYKRHRLAEIRAEFLLSLAPRDPQAALTALAALKTKKIEGHDPLETGDLELQVAAAIAENDSDRAYALAKERLDAKGITLEFIDSFKDLHKRDPALAAKLGKDVLGKIRVSKIRPPSISRENSEDESAPPNPKPVEMEYWQITYFINAASALNRQAEREKNKKTPPVFEEAEMKELAETAARVYLSAKDPAQFSIAQIMPEITRYAPAQAQLVRRKVGAKISRELDRSAESFEYYVDIKDKTADELAQIADRSEPEMRDQRYVNAIQKAIQENDPEKAQTIFARIKDRANYGYISEQIEAAVPIAKARRGDAEAVSKMLARMKTNYERIAALTELASALAAKGETETASKLLDDSIQILMSAPFKNQQDLTAVLLIAAAAAKVAPEHAFTIVEAAAGRMNEHIRAGVLLDEFYNSGSLEADELFYEMMNRQTVAHIPDSTNLLKSLAQSDFGRTVRLTDKFERPEIRLFARLRILQSLLDAQAAEKESKMSRQLKDEDEYQ